MPEGLRPEGWRGFRFEIRDSGSGWSVPSRVAPRVMGLRGGDPRVPYGNPWGGCDLTFLPLSGA